MASDAALPPVPGRHFPWVRGAEAGAPCGAALPPLSGPGEMEGPSEASCDLPAAPLLQGAGGALKRCPAPKDSTRPGLSPTATGAGMSACDR